MRLMIADDHILFRDALAQYIMRTQPSASISLTKDFQEILEDIEQNQQYDLIILDSKILGVGDLNLIKKIKETNTRIAIMSATAEEQDIEAALKSGAVGFFPKTLSGKALLKAIENVLDGQIYIPESIKTSFPLVSRAELPKEKNIKYNDTSNALIFTKSENKVQEFLANGASNKEIAIALGMQIVTVKLHVRAICRKLGVKNRTQAALLINEMHVKSKKCS